MVTMTLALNKYGFKIQIILYINHVENSICNCPNPDTHTYLLIILTLTTNHQILITYKFLTTIKINLGIGQILF